MKSIKSKQAIINKASLEYSINKLYEKKIIDEESKIKYLGEIEDPSKCEYVLKRIEDIISNI